MTDRPKIFVIGFDKCGTTSLHRFFERSGLKSIHYDGGRLPIMMADNLASGKRVIAGYEDYDAFSDLDSLCQHGRTRNLENFHVLVEQEPDSQFILNVRNADRWLESRRRWNKRPWVAIPPDDARGDGDDRPCLNLAVCRNVSVVERHRRYHDLKSEEQVLELWRHEWTEHIAAVQGAIPTHRLLTFDIEQDDPRLLCRFLKLPDDYAARYAHANKSVHPYLRMLARLLPRGVRRYIKSKWFS